MKITLKARLRVEKDVVIRIHRNLGGPGTINVTENEEVTPSDILGTAHISPGFRNLNLATLLDVPPSSVERYLKRSLGQRIYRGELLAYKSGWMFGGKKVVTSPSDAVLDFLNPKTGELKMTFLPQKIDLPAGVYGIVEKVDKEKGQVIIKTQASLVYGMFGSGRVRDGMLHILGTRDELIGKDFLSPKYSNAILAGGSLIFKDAISAAISDGVRGIITGGINAKDYQGMAGGRLVFPKKLENDIGVSIVVCEGFGSIPIGGDIYEVLTEYNGKFISIDGNAGRISLPSFESSSIIKIRNTKLPPAQNSGTVLAVEPDDSPLELKKGSRVRVVGNSFPGEQGIILAIDETETLLPSGIKRVLVTIETNRRKIQLPAVNCEIISSQA